MMRVLLLSWLLLGAQDPVALIEQLRSEDIAVREQAFNELERLGVGAEGVLKKAAGGSDAHVALLAKRLLHILELERTLPAALRKAFPGLAGRLGRSGGTEWTQVYLSVADAKPGDADKVLYRDLTRADLEPLALEAIQNANSSSDKAWACRVASRWFHRSATPAMLKLLRDAEEDVRSAAWSGLAGLWGARQATALALKELSGEPILVAEALRGHGDWADDKTLASLVPLLGHEEERVSELAFDALDDSPTPEAITEAMALLKHEKSQAKLMGLKYLSRQRAREAGPAILALLGDAESEVRFEAFETLEHLGFDIPAGDVVRFMQDEDPDICENAIEFACKKNLPDVLPILRRQLDNEHQSVRRAALQGMKKLKDPELVERVSRMSGMDPMILGVLEAVAPEKAIERARSTVDSEEAPADARCSAFALLTRLKAEPGSEKLRAMAEGSVKPLAALAFTRLVEADPASARPLLPRLLEDPILQRYLDVGNLIVLLAPDDPVPPLLKVLSLPDGNHDSVRRALVARKAVSAIPALRETLKSDDPGSWPAAVDALSSLRAVEARPELLALLSKDDPRLQQKVLRTLAEIGLGDEWRPVAAIFDKEKNDDLRDTALEVLGKRPSKEMIPVFERIIGEPVLQSEHLLAASALVEVGHEGVGKILFGWLAMGFEGRVRDASQLLAAMDPPGFRERILPLLEAREPEIREIGITLVETMGMKEAASKLLPLLRESATAGRAIDALVALDDRALIPDLEALLTSDEFEVRENAIETLVGLQSVGSASSIRKLLGDPDREVQLLAVKALGRLRDRESASLIVGYLKSNHPNVRYGAIRAAGEIGDPVAAPALIPLLLDERGRFQESVAVALGEVKCREALPELLRHLKDPDNHRGILVALGKIGAREVVPDLVKGLESDGCSVCYSRALIEMKAVEAIPALRRLWDKGPQASGSGLHLANLVAELGDSSCLVQLLENGEWRCVAARDLVRLGDSRGVGPMLETPNLRGQWLGSLNAVRNPRPWKKLAEASHPSARFGSRRHRIERFAAAAGFAVHWDKLDTFPRKRWATANVTGQGGSDGDFNLESWERLFGDGSYFNETEHEWTYVLEADHVRVVPVADALVFWKQWWADKQAKKK